MAATYFMLNSTLTAVAVALESRGSAYDSVAAARRVSRDQLLCGRRRSRRWP